jgi:N-acetyl sugar amidotransferase
MRYQICNKTVLDNIADPDIRFDEQGVCEYYDAFQKKLSLRVPAKEEAALALQKLVEKIKKSGAGNRYDCIIGVSGGVDSTYVAWLVKDLGLRPLAVHLDNGWNSELAVKNIENLLNHLQIDLYTEVLDWETFRDLQWSFLQASTPDAEIPTDHIIFATMYKLAAKFGVRYVLSGMNFRSEGFLPPTWARGHLDWKYISGVQRQFGSKKIGSLPHLSVFSFLYYNLFRRIQMIGILNYVPFSKAEALQLIQEKLGYRPYEGKHHESIYTRFFQSYILPKKFGIDKRKAHLSCLIMSTGEITRDEALEMLKMPMQTERQMAQDKIYVIKKLGITAAQFEAMMQAPVKSILDYPNHYALEMSFRKWLNALRRKGWLPN